MQLKVDTDHLLTTAATLANAASNIDGETEGLGSIAWHLRSEWAGAAHAAWAARHAAVDADARHKADVLRRAAQRLSHYADDVAHADLDAARAIVGV